MRNNFIFVLLYSLFQSSLTFAQDVQIVASGAGYENAEFRFYTLSDPITQQLIPVLRTTADTTGKLAVEIGCKDHEQLIIKTGIYNLCLFIEAGRSYQISLPSFASKGTGDDLNPFYQETILIPEVLNYKLCLNNLIRDFENHFNSVYDSVSARLYYNRKKEDIPKFLDELDIFPVTDTISFYTDYVRCRKSVLDLMTYVPFEEKIKATFFINDRTDFLNPAYTKLLGQLYSDYLETISGEDLRSGISLAIRNSSFLQLRDILLKDNKIQNEKLLEYVIILNIYREFYSGRFDKVKLAGLVNDASLTTSFAEIRDISVIVHEKITKFIPGSMAPLFQLLNQSGDSTAVTDFKGKYVLVNFARSDSYPTLSEFSIIKMWQNRYENDLKILTILTDNNFKNGESRLRRAGYNWEILDGSGNEQLILLYEIKMYPSFLLLNREGKIIMAPCLLPSENLETIINDLIEKDRIRSGLVK